MQLVGVREKGYLATPGSTLADRGGDTRIHVEAARLFGRRKSHPPGSILKDSVSSVSIVNVATRSWC